MTGKNAGYEFSRRIAAAQVPDGSKSIALEATSEERAAVARRLGLIGIDDLKARFTLTAEGGGISARGHFDALVIQQCVVTLEPVTNRVAGEIVQRFVPGVGREEGGEQVSSGMELEIDALSEDAPEPLDRGAVELGELVVEHLSLALDPYPRAPEAQVDLPHEVAEEMDNPFAKLRDVKFSATES